MAQSRQGWIEMFTQTYKITFGPTVAPPPPTTDPPKVRAALSAIGWRGTMQQYAVTSYRHQLTASRLVAQNEQQHAKLISQQAEIDALKRRIAELESAQQASAESADTKPDGAAPDAAQETTDKTIQEVQADASTV